MCSIFFYFSCTYKFLHVYNTLEWVQHGGVFHVSCSFLYFWKSVNNHLFYRFEENQAFLCYLPLIKLFQRIIILHLECRKVIIQAFFVMQLPFLFLSGWPWPWEFRSDTILTSPQNIATFWQMLGRLILYPQRQKFWSGYVRVTVGLVNNSWPVSVGLCSKLLVHLLTDFSLSWYVWSTSAVDILTFPCGLNFRVMCPWTYLVRIFDHFRWFSEVLLF